MTAQEMLPYRVGENAGIQGGSRVRIIDRMSIVDQVSFRIVGRERLMADFHFSVFTPATVTGATESELVVAAQEAVRASAPTDSWTVAMGGIWCAVSRSDHEIRPQGWKLHVSATPASAPDVLLKSLPVLLRGGCDFKFVADLTHVGVLNSRNTSRGHSGKFLTIYPDSDDDAVRLAESLDAATAGLAGPQILSDRPYRPGSLVHYRYGAFVERRQFSHDGFYSWVIHDPDGNPVEDHRIGRYAPPEWVSCPFPEPVAPGNGEGNGQESASERGVLVGGRFLAREAIRQTNRGGIYRAVDTMTGADVVIKEARPHVGADAAGHDERDRLRTEAGALRHLAPLGIAPRLVSVFEQAQHLFLTEELVPGVALRQWVPDRIRESGWRREVPQAVEMAERVVRLMSLAHESGVILRDFNPNNIMVRPDGDLRLIDLELAVFPGEPKARFSGGGTPGFCAPEQLRGAPPAVGADYYSLGATLCFVALGTQPVLLEDVPETGRRVDRIAEWMAVRWEGTDLPDGLRALILALLDDVPERRPSPDEALGLLDEIAVPRPLPSAQRKGGSAALPEHGSRAAIEGILGHLVDTMDADDPERLWPLSCAHGSPDPCTVQHGAAGVLGVLTRALRRPDADHARIRLAVLTIAEWITDRLREGPRRSPGLYFGEAGIAWALAEAGWALGRDQLVERALSLAAELPHAAVNPDITHGTAGIGLALLHLARRTADHQLLAKAVKSADAVIAAAEHGPDGLSWGTPAEHHSMLAGRRYHGFAHGSAGVGYFLLSVGVATGRRDCVEVARLTGETLVSHAAVDGDLAQWGAGSGDPATAPHWCHGASGIGTFLIRLAAATGEPLFGQFAEMAGRAVVESAGRGVLAQCHGLAGNGEFLLDLAEATGDPAWREPAERFARLIYTERAQRDGGLVFPDEHGGMSATWGDGMTGVLAFLLRLRHGGRRMWMVDEALGWGERR